MTNTVRLYWAQIAQMEADRRAEERRAARREAFNALALVALLAAIILTSLRVPG